jgi:hypothetical protein
MIDLGRSRGRNAFVRRVASCFQDNPEQKRVIRPLSSPKKPFVAFPLRVELLLLSLLSFSASHHARSSKKAVFWFLRVLGEICFR